MRHMISGDFCAWQVPAQCALLQIVPATNSQLAREWKRLIAYAISSKVVAAFHGRRHVYGLGSAPVASTGKRRHNAMRHERRGAFNS
jgi:hypothetical protein